MRASYNICLVLKWQRPNDMFCLLFVYLSCSSLNCLILLEQHNGKGCSQLSGDLTVCHGDDCSAFWFFNIMLNCWKVKVNVELERLPLYIICAMSSPSSFIGKITDKSTCQWGWKIAYFFFCLFWCFFGGGGQFEVDTVVGLSWGHWWSLMLWFGMSLLAAHFVLAFYLPNTAAA